ncbi:MAG: HAD-IIA family hydrolase [Rhodospirillaceae bacterium]
MRMVSFQDAWAIYSRAQTAGLLPAAPPPVRPRAVSGVLDAVVQGGIKGVVLDAYGVLHTGSGPFPFALEAVAALKAQGMPVLVVTNDVTHPPAQVAARLQAMGYAIGPEDVISGRSLLPEVLADEQNRSDALPGSWAVLATDPDSVCGVLQGCVPAPWSDPEALDACAGFLFIDTNSWPERGPEEGVLRASLERRPRPIILCNPDVTCPYRGALSLEPGFVAFPWAMDIPGVRVIGLGKPYPGVYAMVAETFAARGVARDHILCVGDSPHTDVLGARSNGMKALLVQSGLLAGRAMESYCEASGLWSDFTSEHL